MGASMCCLGRDKTEYTPLETRILEPELITISHRKCIPPDYSNATITFSPSCDEISLE